MRMQVKSGSDSDAVGLPTWAGSQRCRPRSTCCRLMWGWIPTMALWNSLHPTLAAGFGLGQDCHGLKRQEGFTLKGGDRVATQAFLFCVGIHLKHRGQQTAGCCSQVWGRSLMEDAPFTPRQMLLHGWEQLPPFSKLLSWSTFGALKKMSACWGWWEIIRQSELRFKALDIMNYFYELFSTLPAKSLIKNVVNWKLKYPPISVIAFWCFQYGMLRKEVRESSISYTVICLWSWSVVLMRSTGAFAVILLFS